MTESKRCGNVSTSTTSTPSTTSSADQANSTATGCSSSGHDGSAYNLGLHIDASERICKFDKSMLAIEYYSIKLQTTKHELPTDSTQNNDASEAKMIIGIALAVSTGSTFTSLLIALTFHQLFEGLGLGSRIAELGYKEGSIKPWLMSLAYGTTTPLGIAIGIGVRQTYSEGSATALITEGVLDSVSAGILLYAALVELIANDFIYDVKFRKKSDYTQLSAFLCLITGAGIMGLIGYWA
ncbi:4206_t:CDS:2 [Acaulospora colombiana]|uniref:4206_t:CDS:1 n=1 Tax=Acaulospora colombiana TaxID=27376 RepID=A0ACA9LNC9_9GLOM|nr:4206_t:CDS:2 [Acaulospora colombiana]